MVNRWIGKSFSMRGLCSSSLPHLREEGNKCVLVDRYNNGSMFSTSFSAVMGYRSLLGESFTSFYIGMFKTRLFFWFSGLGEDHVVSRKCGII